MAKGETRWKSRCVVITPEIQSQIDGIRAFRAAHGEPKARRFGVTYHEDIPVVFPMEN